MAGPIIVDGDLRIKGELIPDSMSIPPNTVGDAQVVSTSPIQASKLYHRIQELVTQVHGTATVARREVIYVAKAEGNIADFFAGVVVANIGAATITVDLLKNGTTILTDTIVLDNSQAAYEIVANEGVTDDSYIAEDVFEVVVTATAGGGTLGQGLFAGFWSDEKPE